MARDRNGAQKSSLKPSLYLEINAIDAFPSGPKSGVGGSLVDKLPTAAEWTWACHYFRMSRHMNTEHGTIHIYIYVND